MSEADAREIFPPVKFYDARRDATAAFADRDFTPRAVPVEDVDPHDILTGDADPKATSNLNVSSAPGSAENYSDLIPAMDETDLTAPAEKELPLLPEVASNDESLLPDSFKATSAGVTKPPVVTPPSPPALTPSSLTGAK